MSVTKNLDPGVRLDSLTADGWNQVVAAEPQMRDTPMPHAVRLTLPALWRASQVLAVPHLGFVNQGEAAFGAGLRLTWQPPAALAGAPFGAIIGAAANGKV